MNTLQDNRFYALLEVWRIEMPTCAVGVGERTDSRFAHDNEALSDRS